MKDTWLLPLKPPWYPQISITCRHLPSREQGVDFLPQSLAHPCPEAVFPEPPEAPKHPRAPCSSPGPQVPEQGAAGGAQGGTFAAGISSWQSPSCSCCLLHHLVPSPPAPRPAALRGALWGWRGGTAAAQGWPGMLRGALSPGPARTHRSEQLSTPEVSAADLKCTLIARVSRQPARTPAR